MNKSAGWSIQRWVATLVAGVALPVVMLLAWVGVVQVRREQKEARESALGIARATTSRLRELHLSSVTLLEQMADRAQRGPLDVDSCRSVVSAIDFLPRYADAFVYDRTGRLVCSGNTLPANERISREARQWIDRELHAEPLRDGVRAVRAGDRAMLVFFHPLPEAVGGTIALVEFMSVTSHDALVPGALLMILDRTGTVIGRSEGAETWVGKNVRDSRIAELGLHAPEGMAKAAGVDGVLRQYAFVHLPELGWTVYAGIPESAIVGPVREMMLNGALGGIAVLFLVLTMSIVLTRTIARPMQALLTEATTAEAVADGTHAEAGPKGFATLTDAFRKLISQYQAADERTRSSEQRLRALSDRLLTVQEEERTRIAREIHDDLGQALTALKMDVLGMLERTARGAAVDEGLSGRIVHTLDHLMTAIQRISSELRPSILDDLGLGATIESEARAFEQRTGIECEVSLDEKTWLLPAGGASETLDGQKPRAVDQGIATVVYRIIQEALTNVARHSNASRVELRIRFREAQMLVEIRDDGRGLTSQDVGSTRSLGLIGMRERAEMVGGTARFEGFAGRGSIVSVAIPLPALPEESS
ncbi:MAG: ATP-binding protein [Acidobacteriota bacterium]